MTDILSRVLVVRASHHHFPYTRGQVWQIAEYDMEQAIQSLRTTDAKPRAETKLALAMLRREGGRSKGSTDGAFRQRINKGELTWRMWSVSYPPPHMVSSSPP